MEAIKNNTEQLIQLQKQYLKDTTNVPVLMQIANAYSGMGNRDGASKYAGKVLKADPENKAALLLAMQIKSKSNK